MSQSTSRVFVTVAMATTLLLMFPMFTLLMGHCYFEQGCGRYEFIKIIGVFIATCVLGAFAGWGAVGIQALLSKRRS
jgi:hypothetical protein